jgi:hypothetical protein
MRHDRVDYIGIEVRAALPRNDGVGFLVVAHGCLQYVSARSSAT